MRTVPAYWLVILALVAAACTGSDDTVAVPTASDTAQTLDVDPTPPGSNEVTEADLPGEDMPGPEAGSNVAVVGVAADDVLNVRDVPGTEGDIFGSLDPMAEGITTTGRARLVDDALWYEINGGGADNGWVNARFLAHLGETTDITSELDDLPEADTLEQLANLLADARAADAGDGGPADVVISGAPSVGDVPEITVDITGFADDAVRGERLRLFAEPAAGGEGFTLRTVERTLLCARGTSDGLCS